jgi:hypothetical protein
LLLATYNTGRKDIHFAAESYIVGFIQGIMNLAKENMTKEEVNQFFLATNNAGKTVSLEEAKC